MANNKKNRTSGKSFISWVLLATSLLTMMNRLRALVSLEIRLAGKSVIVLLVLFWIMGLLLVCVWLGLLALLGQYLLTLQWKLQSVLLVILMLNIVLTFIVGFSIAKIKKRLSFPETRRLINKMYKR